MPGPSEPVSQSHPGALLSLQRMARMTLTAVYMKVPEGYVAFVEELPGANTQGETLEEARANLEEAVALVLETNRELSEQSLEGAQVIRETLTLPVA
jgi:predicted RNase H-like HicB family nuclease